MILAAAYIENLILLNESLGKYIDAEVSTII
jgi:hypothetical protein